MALGRQLHRRGAVVAGTVAAVVIALGTVTVWSQSSFVCGGGGWPAQLFCFNPNTPAKANQINGNFKQVTDWIAVKTGPVTDPDITASNITVSGDIDAPSGSLSFGGHIGQHIDLHSTNYGIGIQSNTQYYRTYNNFAWYHGGPQGPGIYDAGSGTELMRLDSAGLLVNGPLRSNYNSGWFAVASSTDYSRAHGLGAVPSRILVQLCGAISGGQWGSCTTRVVQVASRGPIRDDGGYINPVSISSTTANIYVGLDQANAWGYWSGNNWHYDGDADGDHKTAFYRILAWR